MGRINVPRAPSSKTTVYGDLRGVDFSVDPSLVDKRRSPDALNMISDNGGNPRKRLGWRKLHQLEGVVHNIWFGEIDGVDRYIAHAGTKIYELGETAVVLREGVADSKGTAFFFRHNNKGAIFILTGEEYLMYDGEEVKNVEDIAYCPTIIISRNPTGGGTVYEPVNLLGKRRRESFLGNGTDKVFQLTATAIDQGEIKVEVANSSGGWDSYTEVSGTPSTNQFSVDRATGKITFNATKAPVITGADNVTVEYSKTIADYPARVKKCTIATLYGVGAMNRVFLGGNSGYKANDYWSGVYDASYFPDTSYAVVGASDTSIMGYQKLGDYLAIVKEDNQQDTTIFLRYGEIIGGEAVFKVKQGIAGIGAIAKGAFCNLGDEPLFLSRSGIYAITSTLLNYERTTKNRSYFVDRRLCAEEGLNQASACEFNNYYILSVNSHCYVLDGRRKAGNSQNGDYGYECFYWENVPAACMLSVGGELYFGTEDGRVCKFNTDIHSMLAYSDGAEIEITQAEGQTFYNVISPGQAIPALWSTPNDNDGAAHLYKTLAKKGCLVTLSPYDRSSGKIYYVVDGDPKRFIRESFMDIFDWENIDFERFTFNSNDSPQEIYFNKKQKKYKRLQLVCENDAINEGFGIHEIVKTFRVSGYSKNRGV